ncbi:MAG TPA: ATP-binding cassette domain-containing protein [Solirubrobacteraceae bacterium]|nr:ATP-binding cassette domain-containing protein [Solirubrobacteraceae bacterium]
MTFDEEERTRRWMPGGANGGQDEPAPLQRDDEEPVRQHRGSEDLQQMADEQRERRPDLPDGPDPSSYETASGTDIEPTHHLPGNAPQQDTEQQASRVSVVSEQPRPQPPDGASEDEYKFHTYKVYPSGRPDAVEFIDVYKAFGRARILRGLNMGLPEGMVSMILGPSGTGKSVCIKHMVGLLYPDRGDILVHGQSVPNMPDEDLFEMRKKFGLLFQDGALFGSMNLYDNVAFPLRQHTEKGEDEIEDIVMRRLDEVGLGDAREKMPNELSGGMRKRAGFARALVLEPDIVLFDEPDSGLDPVRTALLGELILEIHRDMMDDFKKAEKEHLPTFAVITHDIMSARRVADYINVLWRGRIVEAGPAEDMLNSENPFIRQFLAGESQGPLSMD